MKHLTLDIQEVRIEETGEVIRVPIDVQCAVCKEPLEIEYQRPNYIEVSRCIKCSDEDYHVGYDNGYEEGCDVGYENGYKEGYDKAKEEAEDLATQLKEDADESYDKGFNEGYREGYDIGFSDR